jgi:hypothetical protein
MNSKFVKSASMALVFLLTAGIRPAAAQWSPDSVQIHLLCTYGESGRENDSVRMNDPMPTWPEAQWVVAEMARKSGIRNVPKVLVGPVPYAAGAVAAIVGEERVIICNRDFIWDLFNRTSENKWALIAVLAHELGHHLNGDGIDQEGSTLTKEQNADFASGRLMKLLGATLEDAQIAIRTMGTPQATATHPGQRERLHEIQKGYSDDGDFDRGPTPVTSSSEGPGSPAPAPGGVFTGGGSTPATPPSSEGKAPWIFDKYLPHSPIGAAPLSSSEGKAPVPSVPPTAPSNPLAGLFNDLKPVFRLGVGVSCPIFDGPVVVGEVYDGRLGLRKGDQILFVDGTEVRSPWVLSELIDRVPFRGHVRLVRRSGPGGQLVTCDAELDR